MAITLPHPLTPQEIRVLQEFRRMPADTLGVAAIKAIKHPVGGGEAPAFGLVEKGYLTVDDTRMNFTLTEKAREFLAIDYRPEVEEAGSAADAAVE
jgi:hypothetical protein